MTEPANPAFNDETEQREQQAYAPGYGHLLPGTETTATPELMREMAKRSMNESNALAIIWNNEFPSDTPKDEETGLISFSAFFTKPAAVQRLMLDEHFRATAQHAVVDFMTAAAFALVNEGHLSDHNKRYLEAIRQLSPAGAQSLERDLYRIVEGKKSKSISPKVEGKEFEDFFRVGRHELEKLRGDSFSVEPFGRLQGFFTSNPSNAIVKNLGKLPQKLSPALQEVVMDYLRLFMQEGGGVTTRDAAKVWYYYSAILKDVNFDAKMYFFLQLHGKMEEDQARKIFGKLLLNWFEAPKGSSNAISTLVSAYMTTAGKYFAPLLRESRQLADHFFTLAATGRPYESTFAMKILADNCSTPDELKNLAREIAQKDPSIATKVFAARMLNLLSNFPDSSAVIPAMLDGLLESPKVTMTVPYDDLAGGNAENAARVLMDKFPVFADVDEQLLMDALKRRLTPRQPTGRLFQGTEGLVPAAQTD